MQLCLWTAQTLEAYEVINIVYHAYIGAFGSTMSESAEIIKKFQGKVCLKTQSDGPIILLGSTTWSNSSPERNPSLMVSSLSVVLLV